MKNCESFLSGLPQNLVSMAAHFEKVGGVPCIAVDGDGKPLLSPVESDHLESGAQDNPGCQFCRMACIRDQERRCEPSVVRRYGIQQADRFGGSFVFFCPANLVHWVSPVTVEGKTVGALIAGAVLMIDPDDYLGEEVRVPLMLDDGEREILREQFRKISYVPPTRVTSLARVLADMAYSLTQKMANHSLWDCKVENQQARISEYIHQLKKEHETSETPEYPIAKEKELLTLVAVGDHERANRHLNELLGQIIYGSGKNLATVKARVVELGTLLSRTVLDAGAPMQAVFELNKAFLAQIEKTDSVEGLSISLSIMLNRLTDSVVLHQSSRHGDLVHKAVQYLNANFSQCIDLQSVAAHLHISPPYFSKVFKEEMGLSFVHYLNQIRVDRSKHLLRDRSVSLVEISGRVGFEDQSYFTKVFKKVAGISPGRYRKNRGQSLENNLEIHE